MTQDARDVEMFTRDEDDHDEYFYKGMLPVPYCYLQHVTVCRDWCSSNGTAPESAPSSFCGIGQ
jgi:hypothetical protein